MGTENQEQPDSGLLPPEHQAPPVVKPETNEAPARPDARALVEQMLEAGEWPSPSLMEQIVAAGDAAIEPLADVLRAQPRGWPAIGSLRHAISLLGVLRRSESIPELVKIVEAYHDQTSSYAAFALVEFGEPGFDALVSLCSNPALRGYQQSNALDAAVEAAGHDADRKRIVAETARPLLEQALASAREELNSKGSLEKHPPDYDLDDETDGDDDIDDPDDDDEDVAGTIAGVADDLGTELDEDLVGGETDYDDDWDPDDDDELDSEIVVEPFAAEKVAMIVGALASLADPQAHDTIMTAFEAGLVDEAIITRKYVLAQYDETIARPEYDPDYRWLEDYRDSYELHIESLGAPDVATRPRGKYRYEDRYDEGEPPPGIPATAPIRNTSPRLGRNEPCWCGSGKKYKKCHLGKETD